MSNQSARAERTVALLAFEDARSCPVADLMDVAQRQKTASELNAAILASQCQVVACPPHAAPVCCTAPVLLAVAMFMPYLRVQAPEEKVLLLSGRQAFGSFHACPRGAATGAQFCPCKGHQFMDALPVWNKQMQRRGRTLRLAMRCMTVG